MKLSLGEPIRIYIMECWNSVRFIQNKEELVCEEKKSEPSEY